MDLRIKSSFKRVKEDVQTIFQWMTHTHRDVHNLKAKVFELEQRLAMIEEERIEELRTV